MQQDYSDTLSIEGRQFTVKRIICIGRNYPDHAIEMGHNPAVEPPFFFFKPVSALSIMPSELSFDERSGAVHYETEVAIAVDRDERGTRIVGAGVALDLTRRDLQSELKVQGRPWCEAKGFDQSAVVGEFRRFAADLSFRLRVNGEVRQRASLNDMIWDVDGLVRELDSRIGLRRGDIILTGTPSGVGKLHPGDELRAVCSNGSSLTARISYGDLNAA